MDSGKIVDIGITTSEQNQSDTHEERVIICQPVKYVANPFMADQVDLKEREEVVAMRVKELMRRD